MFEYRPEVRTMIMVAILLTIAIIVLAGPHTHIVAAYNATAPQHPTLMWR